MITYKEPAWTFQEWLNFDRMHTKLWNATLYEDDLTWMETWCIYCTEQLQKYDGELSYITSTDQFILTFTSPEGHILFLMEWV